MAKTVAVNVQLTTKQAQENVDELNKSFEAQEDLIESLESDLRKYEKQLGETTGREVARRSKLNEKIKETKNRLNEEKAGLKTINKERKRANTALKESTKNTADYSGVVGILDRQTGGLITSTRNFTGSLTAATKGSKLLRIALLAIPFVGIAAAITSVATAFTNSEKGQNRFRKLMTQIGVVVGNVTDILGNFGNAIISFVTGNFDEAKESIDAVTEGIKNFGEETRKEIEIAGELADMRAKADKAERQLILDRAEANRKVAELREIAANKESVSVEERIDAIKEAGRVEEEITKREIEAARLRFEAKQQENALSESTKEDLDEEARLRARLTELETSRLKIQKALTAEITTALREAETERKQIIQDEINTNKEAANAFIESLKKITEAEKEAEKVAQEEAAKRDADNLARKQRIDAGRIASEQMVLNAKKSAVDQAINLFGAETAAGKAALIAKQVLAAQEMIAEARKTLTFSSLVAARSSAAVAEGTAQTAKIGFPQNIPMLIGYALQAVGIISAISQAVGKSKSVASGLGGGGGTGGQVPSFQSPASGSVPQAPAFNIVGAGGTNQLAQTIAQQTQQPVKAYVVAGDVTTAQSLDRNIIRESALG